MRSKPRVTLATTEESTATHFYRGYVRFLVDKGWDVEVVANDRGGLHAFAHDEGASAESIQMLRNPSPYRDLRALLKWVGYLQRARPNVVVGATPKASLLAMVSAWVTRRPVRVYQVWGLRLETEKGLRRTILAIMERLTIQCANVVVCNSHSLAKALEHDGLIRGKRPVVLGQGSSHGVDLDHYSDSAIMEKLPRTTDEFLAKHPDATVVGFIGRVNADKGLDTLLKALDVVSSSRSHIACIVVGAIEDEKIGTELREYSRRLSIHYAGYATDTRPFLDRFDVLCLPSRREGFPNVVLEAGAMGVPSIVSDATGAVDSVIDGETGRNVRTGDYASLAKAMEDVVDRPEDWAILGENARNRVAAHFSRGDIWERQENLLADLLAPLEHT